MHAGGMCVCVINLKKKVFYQYIVLSMCKRECNLVSQHLLLNSSVLYHLRTATSIAIYLILPPHAGKVHNII